MSLKLNWPDKLSEITLENINSTELWFLRETLESGNFKRKNIGMEVRDPKFGYNECEITIGETRYLIKHKQWAARDWRNPDRDQNIVFYVQKYKRKVT